MIDVRIAFKRVSNYLYFKLHHHEIIANLRLNKETAWTMIQRIWSNTDAVYSGSVGPGANVYFETILLREITAVDAGEGLLVRGLTSKNPLVSAYCLVGLGMIQSKHLLDLSTDLLNRSEILKFRRGCFIVNQSLGEFAAYIQENARSERKKGVNP